MKKIVIMFLVLTAVIVNAELNLSKNTDTNCSKSVTKSEQDSDINQKFFKAINNDGSNYKAPTIQDLQKLINEGANINLMYNGRPALYHVLAHSSLAEILLKNGADPDAHNYTDKIHFFALYRCMNSPVYPATYRTPLEEAIDYNYIETVKTLLKYKASITRINDKFRTPLEYARMHCFNTLREHEAREKLEKKYKKEELEALIRTLKARGKTEDEIRQFGIMEDVPTEREKLNAKTREKQKRICQEMIEVLELAYKTTLSQLTEQEKKQITEENIAFKNRMLNAQKEAQERNKVLAH